MWRAILLAAAILFAAIALFRGEFRSFNESTLQAMPATHSEAMTKLAIAFADIGSSTGTAIITFCLMLFLLLKKQRANLITLGGIVILASGLNHLIKLAVGDPRPAVFPSPHPASGFSFPSGHAASAVALYGTIALLARRWFIVVPCALMILGICWCRLYLGVHWPTDVLAGSLVGTFAIAAGFIARNAWSR